MEHNSLKKKKKICCEWYKYLFWVQNKMRSRELHLCASFIIYFFSWVMILKAHILRSSKILNKNNVALYKKYEI